jgi:diguanylate cyclase (GGDEF)-like protein
VAGKTGDMDIGFFKKYNDTYGHAEGDNCLRAVAQAIRDSVTRDDDFTARYGGEEFVAVLPNTDRNGAVVIAERILENIRDRNIPHEKNDAASCVTVSIGVFTGDVKDMPDSIHYIKLADKALYASKANGRNRITSYTDSIRTCGQ